MGKIKITIEEKDGLKVIDRNDHQYSEEIKSFNLYDFQVEQRKWVDHNFPNTNADEQLLGVVEEVGELCHAVLKSKQKIRGGENQNASMEKEMDAIGDILIYLTGFCNKRGYSLHDILFHTWEGVSLRDWIKYPSTGLPTVGNELPVLGCYADEDYHEKIVEHDCASDPMFKQNKDEECAS